jgi:phosphatidylglycerophosphatase C
VNRRGIAAFDFDGTITRRDTLVPFLIRALPMRIARATLLASPRLLAGAGHWRERAKAHAIARAARGLRVDDLEYRGRAYAADLPSRYQPETIEHIAWHRGQGHELVMVTASLGVYARPAGAALGFDHVIAVELASEDGAYTGHLARPNVRGPEKQRRLEAHLGAVDIEMWAYGNSSGDAEMLAMADHPTWVGSGSTPSGSDSS